MKRGRLGTTGLEVSRLGLGTVQLGMPYGLGLAEPPPDEECIGLVHRALELGITYFDTASAYGRSEELLGRALLAADPPPVVATKVKLCRARGEPVLHGVELERHIEGQLQHSLKRLGLERIDLVQIHYGVRAAVTDELLASMDRLTREGMVRFWGASTYGEESSVVVLGAGVGHFQTLQVAYSLLDRSLEERVIPMCRLAGTALIVRSVFLQGALSTRRSLLADHLRPLADAAARAADIACAGGMTLPEMALRFAAFSPGSAPLDYLF